MNHTDAPWLEEFYKNNPDMYICLESRSLRDSKSISAGVIVDTDQLTNIVIVNVDLSWLDSFEMGKITPTMDIRDESVDPPILIIKNNTLDEVRHVSVAQILLTTINGQTTHITFPWLESDYYTLNSATKWIFMSLQNLVNDEYENFHWGYGDFKNQDAYEKYFFAKVNFP